MSAVGITENAKGDNKKFEIWCNSREEVYIVQVCKQKMFNTVDTHNSDKKYTLYTLCVICCTSGTYN